MNYKIIATDFDGTLLKSDKTVSEKTKNAIINYKKENHIIIGVTARNLSSVKSILDIKMFNYLILNNGAYLYDVEKDEGKYIKSIDKETIQRLTNYFKDKADGIDYITAEKYYMYRNRGKIDKRSFVVNIKDADEVKDYVSRINVMPSTNRELEPYKEFIKKNYEDLDCISMRDTDVGKENKTWIAINPKGVNKLTTLQKLCEELNISTDNVIFFGDSTNDIEIIKNVGLGVAMENASPEVIQIAKETTITNDEDGVVYFLEKIFGV